MDKKMLAMHSANGMQLMGKQTLFLLLFCSCLSCKMHVSEAVHVCMHGAMYVYM